MTKGGVIQSSHRIQKAFPNEERHGCILCTTGEGVERDNGAFDG